MWSPEINNALYYNWQHSNLKTFLSNFSKCDLEGLISHTKIFSQKMLNAHFAIKKKKPQLTSYFKQVFYSKINIKSSAEISWRDLCRCNSQKSEEWTLGIQLQKCWLLRKILTIWSEHEKQCKKVLWPRLITLELMSNIIVHHGLRPNNETPNGKWHKSMGCKYCIKRK